MQGLIFNLLGERVSEAWGEAYWTDLIAETPGMDNPVFVGPKNYPDEGFTSLVTRVSTDRGMPMDELLVDFGRWCFPRLAATHPVFLEGYGRAQDFLLTVEDVVHTEVRKLYDDAYLPRIRFERPTSSTLVAIYHSKRKLCWLAEGLIRGVGDFFGEEVSTAQEACMHEGAPECRIRVDFEPTRA